jgi:hypothetical protein
VKDKRGKTDTKKQNNPFSEQEKHGDEAQRRGPRTKQEAKGGSVQPPFTGGNAAPGSSLRTRTS